MVCKWYLLQYVTAVNLILQYLSEKSMDNYNKWHKYMMIWHAKGRRNLLYLPYS